jgi:predicted dehydrogenase
MKKKLKLLLWSCGFFFKKKILPILISNKFTIEKIFTKKKIRLGKINITNSEKIFFSNNKSKFIYINSAQKLHYHNIKKSLNNKLNVICEKTLCSNFNETKNVINLAKRKNLKIFCTIYYTFHPAFKKIKKLINDKSFGRIKYCFSSFGFNNNFKTDKSYRSKKFLGGSAILDLGFYPLSLEFFLFNKFKKKVVSSGIIKSKKLKIDISGNVHLNDKDFNRYYFWGYNNSYQNFIKIVFERGEIFMNFPFSKNLNLVKLKVLKNNKLHIFKYKNFSQETIAFQYYLQNKFKITNFDEILNLSKLIDKIKMKK